MDLALLLVAIYQTLKHLTLVSLTVASLLTQWFDLSHDSYSLADLPFHTRVNQLTLTLNLIFLIYSYGAKIRAPHALVMTFLFRSGR